MDCIFCEILRGNIPSQKVFENETVYAFRDIKPCAPVHILIVPKTHIASADEIDAGNADAVRDIFLAIPDIGEDGGQTVKHLHFHLLGGQKFAEKLV